MKKRLLSMFLAMTMVLSMLPATALAAAVTDPADAKVGDTYTGASAPAETENDGVVWVMNENSETSALTCSGHEHTDDCYALNCGHDFGHTADCYEGGTPDKWVVCTPENCECYETYKVFFFDYTLHYGMDVEAFCKAMGLSDRIAAALADVIASAGIKTCTCCANNGGLSLLERRFGENIPEAYAWLNDAQAAAGDSIINYVHYEPGEGATLTCDHECSDSCKELTCNGHHEDSCYTTHYTWTLKADVNNNNIPDELESKLTVSYVGNGNTSGSVPASTEHLVNTTVTVSGNTGNLAKEGAVFLGFSKIQTESNVASAEEEAAAAVIDTFIIEEDTALYAVWAVDANGNRNPDYKENKVSLIYEIGTGSNGPATEYLLPNLGEYTLSSAAPTHAAVEGVAVVFIGWTAGSNNAIYAAGDIAPTTISKVTIAKQNVTVYAAYGYDTDGDGTADVLETCYTVTYVSNGQTVDTETVPEGGKATAPSVTNGDLSLAGWYLDGATTAYDFKTIISDNITLTAKWIKDGNGNGVNDDEEIITVSVTGNGTVTITGADAVSADGGKTYVYDSTAEDTTITVAAAPAAGNYLVSVKVDDVACNGSFTASGNHTVAVGFDEMSIYAEDGEMNRYGIDSMTSDELVAAIKDATSMEATPEFIEDGVVTKYLALDYTVVIPENVLFIGGQSFDLVYWAVPGEDVSLDNYLSSFGSLASTIKKYIGDAAPHAFGAQDAETVRYTYGDLETIVTVTLKDLRKEATIVLNADVLANGIEVVYNSYTNEELLEKINPVITDDAGNVLDVTVSIEDMEGKSVGEYEAELTFAGNDEFKNCTATVTVIVTKAPVEVEVKSQTVKYGQGYTYEQPISTTPEGVKTIDFVVGLDAHDETNLTYTAQVVLPIDSNVANWLKSMGVNLSGTMSLSELKNVLGYLVDISDYIAENELLEAILGDYAIDTTTVTTLVNALEAVLNYLPEGADLEIQVTTELALPENVGLYLIGAVTSDPNYQTAFNVGYLVITPNGIKVKLEWSYVDENGVLTIPAFNAGNFDLSATGAVVESTVEGANHPDDPDDHIKYLFMGVNKNGELLLSEELALDSKAGVYLEVAYLTNWDNEMYYAQPIARSLLLAPGLADVAFIDENGYENYARVYVYDGSPKSMKAQVTVNGTVVAEPSEDLTVTYVGIDGHAEGYNSTTAPTEAGVYAVVAVYTDYNNGELYVAGSAAGVLVIEKAEDDSFKLEDAYYCYDGEEHFAAVINPKGFDYISIAINRDTNTAYVMLPDDLGEHIADLPEDVQGKVSELVSKLDGEVSNTEVINTISAAIDELIALDLVGEAEGLIDELLAQAEDMVDLEALEEQVKAEIEALKEAVKAQLPDEVEALLKEIINTNEADLEAVKDQLLAEIEKLELPETVIAELKDLVSDLADKVSSNEDVIALTAQIEEVIAKLSAYEIPEAEDIVKGIVGVMAGAVSQTELDEILADVIAKVEARGYAEDAKAMIKNIAGIYSPSMDTSKLEAAIDDMLAKIEAKASSGELDADDLKNFEIALDSILTELKGVVSQLPNGTIIFGENPSEIGVYDCYAITLAANYKSVFAQATLTIADHIWDDGEVTTEPTCTEEGEKTFTCEKCDKTKTEPVDALDHSFTKYESNNDATCTEDGTKTAKCDRCDATDTKADEGSKLGHNMVDDKGYAATCTATGLTDGKHCTRCDDETVEQVQIPALGHSMGNWYVVKYPTVLEKGMERRDCSRCDHYELREIPAVDVEPNIPDHAYVNVKYLNTKDHMAYIIGYTDGTIKPQGKITRAEIATIYFRLMDDETRENFWSTENDFADVNENNWFNLAVSTLNNAGVIVDVKDGNFRPNDPITRAELAVMAAQFCTVTGKLPKTIFTDVDKDHWAADEIALIKFAGWIEGYPDGTFRPDNTITRAEAITIINRMLCRAVEDEGMLEGMMTFVDCPANEWFFEAVQEATNSHKYKRTIHEVKDYGYNYEIWTKLLESPDWAAIEKAWSEAR